MKTSTHVVLLVSLAFSLNGTSKEFSSYTFEAGHPSLQGWLLPDTPPYPENNAPNPERIELGKKLFFDPRLSGDGNMSCASCHNPMLGWSDGLPTAKGFQSMVLGRATPVVTNTAYNSIQMWDGRKKSLEDQAMGPMEASVEMNTDVDKLLSWLGTNEEYQAAFEEAYPGEGITTDTVSKAIASFERTVISNNSPFDAWVKGDNSALTTQQVEGFKLFADPNKGNCAVCHSGANFTDNGFHNIGLSSFEVAEPDMGRYSERPLNLMRGAFKTPTLRDITLSAPYFHDGSSENLDQVMDHYLKGGEVQSNLSPNMKALELDENEKEAIIAFLESLTSPPQAITLPNIPTP